MSEQQQAGTNRYREVASNWLPIRLAPGANVRKAFLLAMVGLVGGMGTLTSCSNENGRGPNSEMRVDPPGAAVETKAPASGETPLADNEEPLGALIGAGRKYRVAVATAYLFDKPEQSTPSGRYLRRGDTFFGGGETNGFVKTGFVQPNGSTGTAWLKVQELSKLGDAPAAPRIRRRAPTITPQPTDNEVYNDEPFQPGADQRASSTPTGGAATAIVQVGRSYFYNSPDLAVPRKAYCERGDKVRLGESRSEAVYVTFTNWEKVTTTGWMKKAALGL